MQSEFLRSPKAIEEAQEPVLKLQKELRALANILI